MIYVLGAVVVALAAMFLLIGIWWGAPIVLVAGILAAFYVAAARREGEPVGTVERGRRPEPTGVPRKSSPDAETANERVGQT